MRNSALTALAVLAVTAAPIVAQSAPIAGDAPVARNPAVPVQAQHAEEAPSGLRARAGRMFTGAVVGGWLGYFASQLVVSDWDAATNSSLGHDRGAWAAAGVLSGAVVGRLVNPGAARPVREIDTKRGRSILTREVVVKSGATNAHDLIRSMRAEWLQPRGINSFTESARGYADINSITVVPGEDHILVYLDNAKMGGTQHLPDLPLADVQQIEFIEGPQATFRWGAGHAHGVILITTMDARGRGAQRRRQRPVEPGTS